MIAAYIKEMFAAEGLSGDIEVYRLHELLMKLCGVSAVPEDEDTFFLPFTSIIKTQPFLVTAIVTHVFDMIENLNEC